MVDRPKSMPNKTPSAPMPPSEAAKPKSNRKRKASALEVNALGGLRSPGNHLPNARKSTESKIVYTENSTGNKNGTEARRKRSRKDAPTEEKRLRLFQYYAPHSHLERLARVRSQRMFLIDRERSFNVDDGHDEEMFDIAGTTGNIYQVKIDKMPSCTCPDAENGYQCKHIIYILVNVLKVPENMAYQLAFLSTELKEIFASAPSAPQSSSESNSTNSAPVIRKPVEGDCPVCVMEFKAGSEKIVWCKAACGNNIHEQCFERWAASKAGQAKCVLCRAPWKADRESVKCISNMGKRNNEGYVNIAGQLGISDRRESRRYYQPPTFGSWQWQ